MKRAGVFFLFLRTWLREAQHNELPLRAAALAYYAAFSLLPLLLFVMNALRYLTRDMQAHELLLEILHTLTPDEASQIFELLLEIAAAHNISNWVLLPSLLWAASGFLTGLLRAVDHIHAHSPPRGSLLLRGIGLALAFSVPLLTYAYFLLAALLRSAFARLPLPAWYDLNLSRLLLALFLTAGFYLLYRLLPAQPIRRRAALIAAIFTTGGWLTVSLLFDWYLRFSLPRLNLIYGSLATTMALFFYFYLSSLVVLFGAQLNALLPETYPAASA